MLVVRLEFEYKHSTSCALRDFLELGVAGEHDEILFGLTRRAVFPTEVDEGIIRLLDIHQAWKEDIACVTRVRWNHILGVFDF